MVFDNNFASVSTLHTQNRLWTVTPLNRLSCTLPVVEYLCKAFVACIFADVFSAVYELQQILWLFAVWAVHCAPQHWSIPLLCFARKKKCTMILLVLSLPTPTHSVCNILQHRAISPGLVENHCGTCRNSKVDKPGWGWIQQNSTLCIKHKILMFDSEISSKFRFFFFFLSRSSLRGSKHLKVLLYASLLVLGMTYAYCGDISTIKHVPFPEGRFENPSFSICRPYVLTLKMHSCT